MNTTIGIVAPMMDSTQVYVPLVLKLKQTGQELTLKRLHDLAKCGFDVSKLPKDYVYTQDIPTAGYYLTSLLRSYGYETCMTQHTHEQALQRMADASPRVVCISSTMIMTRESLKDTIDRVRTYMPDVKIVIGGILVWKSYLAQHLPQSPELDRYLKGTNTIRQASIFPCRQTELAADAFVISPHGGEILLHLLKEFDKGSQADLTRIANLAIPGDDGLFAFTSDSYREEVNYDEEYTNWGLIDELPDRIPIRTSIGCPYRCGYCDFCQFFPKILLRSPESIAAELKTIRDRITSGESTPSVIHFTDDNVFINRRRVEDICQTILDSKVGLFWLSFMRVSSLNESNVDLAKRSGLIMSLVGLESGDQEHLDRMGKKQDLKQAKHAIELLDGAGINVQMSLVVGYPGETETTLHNTANFLNNLDIGLASSCYQLYPLFVSPFSRIGSLEERTQWNLYGLWSDWSHDTMSSENVREACYSLFKQVPSVPYNYLDESRFFNRFFGDDERKHLFRLRQQLTIQYIENAPWEAIAETYAQITAVMKMPDALPSDEFRAAVSTEIDW